MNQRAQKPVDWIEEELLSKLTKIETGELDMMTSGPILDPYADHTYEQLHGSPVDFWKGSWYWEIFGFPGALDLDLCHTTDPDLRSSRKYYDVFKETVETTTYKQLHDVGNDPSRHKDYRDVLRMVIESTDRIKRGIMGWFLRCFKSVDKSGPGEDPIALVAVWQAEKDKDGDYEQKGGSQAIVLELQRAGFDFDETNGKGESANSVLSSQMKKLVREREQEEFHMWEEGEATAAAWDPNYVFTPPTNHCGCNWSENCCNRYRQPGYMDEPGEFLGDYW